METPDFKSLKRKYPEFYKNSILSILFSEKEFQDFESKFKIATFNKGDELFKEGEQPTGLYLILSGSVELYNGNLLTDGNQGKVMPYRTPCTYSSLSQHPYPYSASFESEGEVLFVATEILKRVQINKPKAIQYLLSVSGNFELRMIAKNIDEIDCGQDFKVEFVTSLKEKIFRPHEVVCRAEEDADFAYFPVDGQLIFEESFDGSIKKRKWVAPIRTWHLWSECLNGKLPTSTLKAIYESKTFALEKSVIDNLNQRYPSDLRLLSDHILQGASAAIEQEPVGEEVYLKDLFENTKEPNLPFWKSYPWALQSDKMDCGPACLTMISKSYGKSVTLQYWRHQLSTDRSGTSVYDLAVGAEKNGFITAAIQENDIRNIDRSYLPCIAVRKNHFVVIYEISANQLVVGDPEVGILKPSIDDFHSCFEQVVLLLKPTDSFDKLPEQTMRFKHFFSLVSDMKAELLISFFISFLLIILGLGAPLITQIFLDDVLVRRDMSWMWMLFASGLLLVASQSSLSWAKTYYLNHLSIKVDYRLNSILLKKILRLPFKYHSQKHVGDFTTRFQDLNKIKFFLLHTAEDIVLSILSIVVYSFVLFTYTPIVACTAFASLPIYALMSWAAGRRLVQIDQEIFKKNAEVETSLTDTFKGVAAIKSLGGELASRWRFEEKFVDLLKLERTYEMNAESINVAFRIYLTVVRYGITGLCMYLAIAGDLSAGQVLATTMIAASLFSPLISLTSKIGEIQHVFAVVDRVNDVLLEKDEFEHRRGRLKPPNFRGEIEFRDVWFRYGTESSDWVLKGISFKLEPGQHIAIVGPSGSGKSTIATLINRMLVPTKGQIFIDGRNYLDYDIDWLREKIGILQQETPLFSGSLMENIAFSQPEFDLEKVIQASEEADAHELIMSKPTGYSYVLAASGSGLSGGEKQKVALARTFFRKPSILILDEATSALDGKAESQILYNIKNNPNKMTVINIAHRFSTAVESELVMVVAGGKVIGMGTHQAMANNNLIYQSLFKDYLTHEKLLNPMRKAS